MDQRLLDLKRRLTHSPGDLDLLESLLHHLSRLGKAWTFTELREATRDLPPLAQSQKYARSSAQSPAREWPEAGVRSSPLLYKLIINTRNEKELRLKATAALIQHAHLFTQPILRAIQRRLDRSLKSHSSPWQLSDWTKELNCICCRNWGRALICECGQLFQVSPTLQAWSGHCEACGKALHYHNHDHSDCGVDDDHYHRFHWDRLGLLGDDWYTAATELMEPMLTKAPATKGKSKKLKRRNSQNKSIQRWWRSKLRKAS